MSVGSLCPSITGLTFIKGSPINIGPNSAEKATVTVLEFWATWCPPCRDSIPHLTSIQKKYKNKNVNIIGISIEKDVTKVKQFVDQQGSNMDYTVAVDASSEAQRQLLAKAGSSGIPFAFVVGTDNKIAYSGHPMDPAFEAALDRAARSASDRHEKKELPLVKQSLEELMALPVKDLKKILADRSLSTAECVEKVDLAQKIARLCSSVKYYS